MPERARRGRQIPAPGSSGSQLSAGLPGVVPTALPAGASRWAGFRSRLAGLNRSVVWLILALKLLLFVFGLTAVQVLGERPLTSFSEAFRVWNRWDTPHYLDLAQYGYSTEEPTRLFFVFFPLYPQLIKIATLVVGDAFAAALLVSSIASVAAGLLLYRLVRLDGPDDLAWRAVWFLFIFPTSYFLHIGYTESVFLMFVLACMLAARQERWEWAGVSGACASYTRLTGLLLLPVLAVGILVLFQQRRGLTRAGSRLASSHWVRHATWY
jgi:Gpi18-like mannosyltransferase